MSHRLADSITYIQNLAGAVPAAKVQTHATRVAAASMVEKLLKFPIGSEEKVKAMMPSFMNVADPKDGNYRKAARALLLLDLIYDFHGIGSVDAFMVQRRQAILMMPNEGAIQGAITNKLNALANVVLAPPFHREYDDRTSTAAPVQVSVFAALGQQAGMAPAMLAPRGMWRHRPMNNHPGLVDFAAEPKIEGLFTRAASGGCIVTAFLYGGRKGEPLKALSLVHCHGGDPAVVQWAGMQFGNHNPTSIVVFLCRNNAIDINSERTRYLNHLTNVMNFADQLILFHVSDRQCDHGVDKHGNFGMAFSGNHPKASSGNMLQDYDVTF